MFSQLLVDSTPTHDKRMVGGRSPKLGEETMEILSEEAIRVYLMYYKQLKVLFTTYIHTNFNAKSKEMNWRAIEDVNQKMYVSAFLKLARCQSLIAHQINIETLHDFIEQVIPPITAAEVEYLEKDKTLLKKYNEDKSYKTNTCEPVEGEPGLLFHEFIFLLGQIALHATDHTPVTAKTIEDFFIEKLNFKKQTSIPQYGEDDEYDDEVESDDELEMDEQ